MLLVHALMRADDARRLDEVDAGRVHPHAVAAGGLVAAVSVAPDHGLTEDDAVAHLDLLTALAADVPVLPLALGTTAPDEDAVREEILTPLADQLEHWLAAVADLVELRLTLTFDTDAVVADATRGDHEIARLAARTRLPGTGMDERIALGEMVAGRVAETQQTLAEQWTTELAGIAERSVVLGVDEQSRREAHLVRRNRIAAADAAVERLRRASAGRAAVEWVGPLPVYSFLDGGPAEAEPAPRSRWGW
jgi:hypothetical protein